MSCPVRIARTLTTSSRRVCRNDLATSVRYFAESDTGWPATFRERCLSRSRSRHLPSSMRTTRFVTTISTCRIAAMRCERSTEPSAKRARASRAGRAVSHPRYSADDERLRRGSAEGRQHDGRGTRPEPARGAAPPVAVHSALPAHQPSSAYGEAGADRFQSLPITRVNTR